MIIKRIRIERFKRLVDFDHELSRSVTVVRGPNESGKSTLIEGIVAALFANPGSSSERVRGFFSWGHEEKARISLEVDVEEGPAVINKDFEHRKVSIETIDGAITAAKKAQTWIAEQLGCSSENLFLATACVREADIEIPKVSGADSCSREIVARLQAMLTGGPGGSPRQVIKRIKKRIDAIDRRPTSANPGGGRIQQVRIRLDEALRKLTKLRRDFAAVDLAATELGKVTQRRSTAEGELVSLKTVIGNHRLYRQAEKEKEDLAGKIARLTRAEERMKDLDRAKRSLRRFEGYEVLETRLERLRAIGAERGEIETRMNELGRERFEGELKPSPSFIVLAAAAVFMIVAGGLLAALLGKPWPAGLIISGLVSGGVALALKAGGANR